MGGFIRQRPSFQFWFGMSPSFGTILALQPGWLSCKYVILRIALADEHKDVFSDWRSGVSKPEATLSEAGRRGRDGML
jgi:hypothetical protein